MYSCSFALQGKKKTTLLVELYGIYFHGFFHSVLIVGLIWVACSTEFFITVLFNGLNKKLIQTFLYHVTEKPERFGQPDI